ncbi:EAL and GGDEF domain-containing protein [Rhizobium tubonense]|uniref:Histidine kinase n=1 Tax=Rhizobium tubonense TaxID=484088 RepID=A0A2W4CMF6_9HYPH|nr:EAL domain-containing protein [Rhizobium tubonense]PZM13939.1 histidine kinase [Rhizobium tubonense]
MQDTHSRRRLPEVPPEQSQIAVLQATVERLQAGFDDSTKAKKEWSAERTLLRAMVDHVPDALFVKDLQSRFIIINRTVARFHGLIDPDEVIGKTDFDLHTFETASKFFEIEQRIMQTGSPMIDMEEVVIDRPTGDTKWLSTSKVAMRNDQGEIVGLVGISRDVTVRKRDEILREEQAHVLEMIAMNLPLEKVLERIVLLMETQLQGVFGSILLLDPDGTHLKHGAAPSLPAAYNQAIDGTAIGPGVGSCGTAAYRRESVIVTDIANDPLWVDFRELAERYELRSCWSTPIISHLGAVLGTFAMYSRDIRAPDVWETNLTGLVTRIAAIAIERKLAEDQIIFVAHHDSLTGLANRTLLKDRLVQAMLQTERYNPCVSVVFVDLDDFKSVNDSLGHAAGDQLLKIVAGRMVDCVRPIDAVVRLGGDEFVILLVDQPEGTDAISATLDKMRMAIAEPISIEGRPFHIACSMGVATYPNDGPDAEALLTNADAAMYKAKEAGGDGFQFFTAEMNVKVHERLALQDAMRDGIGRSEFYLVYQPQVDIQSGRIFAVEALVRWKHPVRGVISPNEFITLAEETGLIVPLGDWVLNEACRQNKAWQDAGLPPVSVCVNVSARQFQDKKWTSHVTSALEESGLDARYLELELTESLVMRDVDQAIVTMKELQALGVHFAIDDFGTGYSSLSALKSLPVSRLKIDQSFVLNLATDEDDRTIAAVVISLGQRLNLKVIAEGVETNEQLGFLRDSHCDEFQGYLFSRPVEAAAIAALLQA